MECLGKEQSLDNVKNDNKNNRIDKSQSDAIIDLLQIIVEKLYELKNAIDTLQTEVTLQKKEIKEIKAQSSKKNMQNMPIKRTVSLEKEKSRVVIQENYDADYIAEREPRLKEEFKIFVVSSVNRLKDLSNVSSTDFADFILVDSDRLDMFSGIDKSKIIVILSDEDNPLKYTMYNTIRDDYTERQIYNALKIASSRNAFQNYGYNINESN